MAKPKPTEYCLDYGHHGVVKCVFCGLDKKPPCCCSYGAAVSGEWPEFQCHACPVHTDPFMAGPDDLCRRHRREKGALVG